MAKTYKHRTLWCIAKQKTDSSRFRYIYKNETRDINEELIENSSDREPVVEECPEWIKKCIRDIEEVGENWDEATFIRILKSNAPKQRTDDSIDELVNQIFQYLRWFPGEEPDHVAVKKIIKKSLAI